MKQFAVDVVGIGYVVINAADNPLAHREVESRYPGRNYNILGPVVETAPVRGPLTELEKRLQKYESTAAYKTLIAAYSLHDHGQWEVFEENNDDLGGRFSRRIAVVEGHLNRVVEWAVMHDDFTGWGRGGEIRRYVPPRIIKL